MTDDLANPVSFDVAETVVPGTIAPFASVTVPEIVAEEEGDGPSSARYRTQRRGGKGLRDIKATSRNGAVISVVRVDDQDEVLMISARGKLQRIRAADISVIGRNTQGVRIMTLDEGDIVKAVVRVPKEETVEIEELPPTENPAPIE